MTETKPKAFISYSWSSPGHCDQIRQYAERLVNDGVDVILDQWDLSEGQDKYAFMEKMVADESVTHVIIFSDKAYSEKADARAAGVGTESQIISKEIYSKVDQKKFIPVVCERQEGGEPYLPVFLGSRIWIDFSSSEQANENWERLVRAVYGQPIHQKPSVGRAPSYLNPDAERLAIPTIGKFESLKSALLNSKPTASLCRDDFLSAVFSFVDSSRVRARPEDLDTFDEKVISDLRALLPIRDQLIDWLTIEAALPDNAKLEAVLVAFLERFLSLKYKPAEINQWNDAWFDAHSIFVYELFLYVVATLIKADLPELVHEVLTTHLLLPESEAHQNRDFVTVEEFFTYSQILANRNKRLNLRRVSLLADLMKERATRTDIPFRDVMQSELVITLMSLLSDGSRWYPHTLIYAGHGGTKFPLFVRGAQHKHYRRIQTIVGGLAADELRTKVKEGYERHGVNLWNDLSFHAGVSIWNAMNMDALDTIK